MCALILCVLVILLCQQCDSFRTPRWHRYSQSSQGIRRLSKADDVKHAGFTLSNPLKSSNLRTLLHTLTSQWSYVSAASVALLVADSLRFNKKLQDLDDEHREQSDALNQLLTESENERKLLEEQCRIMQEEVSNLTVQLDEFSEQIHVLQAALQTQYSAASSEEPGISNKNEMVNQLEQEVAHLRRQLHAFEQTSATDNDHLVATLKQFLSTAHKLSEGVVSNMTITTAAQVLEDLLTHKTEAQRVVSTHHPEDKEKIKEQQKQLKALQKQVDKLSTSLKTAEDLVNTQEQEFTQWLEEQSAGIQAVMKKGKKAKKFNLELLQALVRYHEDNKLSQEAATSETQRLQLELANRDEELQHLRQELSALSVSTSEQAVQHSLGKPSQDEKDAAEMLATALDQQQQASTNNSEAVPSSGDVKKLESSLKTAKVLAKELQQRLDAKEAQFQEMVSDYECKLKELQSAKAKNDYVATQQALILEEELKAVKYESTLKYVKTPDPKGRGKNRAKLIPDEEDEEEIQELSPEEIRELFDLEEIAQEAAGKQAVLDIAEEDRQIAEELKDAWIEINNMNKDKINKDYLKKFIERHNLPIAKEEMRKIRKSDLFNQAYQYIAQFTDPKKSEKSPSPSLLL